MSLNLFQYGQDIKTIMSMKYHELIYWDNFLKKHYKANA
jgi:hypothetical protein